MSKETKRKIGELTDRELTERQTTHLAEINKSLKSIKGNVAFLFWVTFLGFIGGILVLMS